MLNIDYNFIEECNSYVIALHQGKTIVRINKSAFDNIDTKYTKKRNGKIFLACPQSDKGLLNFLPVQFVYKRMVRKGAISFIS
jgi:hypothetical protein